MRQILAPLALLALAAAPCRADTITFARVWPQWHDSGSFESYHEYRTGKELVQDWIVMRTQPKSRSGLYFLTRVLNHGPALASATFTVRVIKPDSVETRVYSFPATVPAGSRLFGRMGGGAALGGRHAPRRDLELPLGKARPAGAGTGAR